MPHNPPAAAGGPSAATPPAPPAPPPGGHDLIRDLQRKDLDELARRLADPLDRLRRAEDSVFHERSGRLYDTGF